jgi:hypothetical protein
MGMLGLGGDKTPNDYGKNAIKLKNTRKIIECWKEKYAIS